MVDILIFDSFNRNLWIFTISFLIVCALVFLRRAQKCKNTQERYFFFGLFAVFIGLATQRLFFFISDYFATGYYVGDAYYGFYNIDDMVYTNLVGAGYLAFFISMTISFVFLESVIKESKYVCSLFSFVALMTFLYIPISYKVMLRYVLVFLNGTLLFVILIRFLRFLDKKYQEIAKIMIISLSLYVAGSFMDMGVIKELAGSPSFPITFFILSAFMGLYTITLKLDEEKK